jgi:pimeloyl-ACP methyl ester carboxylesterase
MTTREMAADVHNFIKENNLISNLVILGHSMGARVTMAFSHMYPELLKGAVIVDMAPYDYSSDPRFSTGKGTKAMLEKLVKIDMDGDYKEIAEQIRAAAQQKAVSDFVMTNIRKDDESGKYKWKCNLPSILSNFGEVVGVVEGAEKGGFKGSVKVIMGADSEYYFEDVMSSFKKLFPNINEKKDIAVVKGAGHWVHFVKPVEFVDEVSHFLKNL